MVIIQNGGDIIYQIASKGKLFTEAQCLRHDVYLQVGYIQRPCKDGIIPDSKDEISDYIIALDYSLDEVVGTMRITPVVDFKKYDLFRHWKGNMLPGAEEKIAKIFLRYSVAELGALAAKKNGNVPSKRKGISWGLYKSTFLYSLIKEIDYWVIGMDSGKLVILESLGWHVERLGKPIEYFGSVSELGLMSVNKQLGSIYNKNPRYYQYIAS
ncbi:MAG: hypothetical protein GYA69_01095 [Candidatus Moranbacteria bacterium]|jgi:hypothetical protein|nr:hypothetical protein [Candidatus Moranbacteria bacterium]